MTRILAVADEVSDSLYGDVLAGRRPDVVLSCGDLPFDYLEYLVSRLSVPLLYVPGNHDPELRARADQKWPAPELGSMREPSGPPGGMNVDGRIIETAGLRIAGLGGSARYSDGPNQYTERQMRRRAARLRTRAALNRFRGDGRVDVLITHAPPLGLGDEDDPAHRGFAAFRDVVEKLRPNLLLHGHIHPYGRTLPDRSLGSTRIMNVIPYRLVEVEPSTS
jgi:predicted phosphodiesterase